MSGKLNKRICEHFVIGVDLGVGMQPTAIAVIKQEVVDMIRRGREVRSMQLVYLERLPLDASYAKAIDAVKRILEEVKDKEQDTWRGKPRTDVVVDITGTGRAVGDLMTCCVSLSTSPASRFKAWWAESSSAAIADRRVSS